MKRLLMLLVIAGMLISAGCTSQKWQVYSEQEIRSRAVEKMDAERWITNKIWRTKL